jgi:UDP-N-acetyl-D-glucosamine/UDP-N-acetyl-D-galactosamine dehydrogenase
MTKIKNLKIGIIGLGYVGLPLAFEFAKCGLVVGYDTNKRRISELCGGYDSTLEMLEQDFQDMGKLTFSSNSNSLVDCNCYIITVPTPVTTAKQPDMRPLREASQLISSVINKNDIVIFESTVYPGATEEFCVPIIEKGSNLKYNQDFFVGYSPERINPGDKEHRVKDIVKITSGSTPETADVVDKLYASIITAGTFKASSIAVAEAAKVIENTQRDINIALINELAIIFNEMEIDTEEVLLAAGSKWNFLPFRPGLVGGHCIGVDPYYLTYKAQFLGYEPQMILAGRRINDGMGQYVAQRLIKQMSVTGIDVSKANVLILGFSFKENCPDIRNTKVLDVYNELSDYGIDIDVFDPWVDPKDALSFYGVTIINTPKVEFYDAVVIAVNHDEFRQLRQDGIKKFMKQPHIIYDLKYALEKTDSILRL